MNYLDFGYDNFLQKPVIKLNGQTALAFDATLEDEGVIGAKIATGAISADKIQAGAVTATKIDVINLQAITTNTGTLNVDELITVGDDNVQIDGENNRILIGNNVLLGLF